jgi:hypothetical protein
LEAENVPDPPTNAHQFIITPATPTLTKIDPKYVAALDTIHQQYQYLGPHQLLSYIKSNRCVLPPGITYKNVSSVVQAGWHCAACSSAKQRHTATKKSTDYTATASSTELELHIDICGPFAVDYANLTEDEKVALDNKKYMLLVVERNSKAVFPIPMKSKDEADKNIQWCVALIRTLSAKRVATVRTDGGGEFNSERMVQWFALHSIHHDNSIPHESNMNATVERWIYVVVTTARSCLQHAFLPAAYWPWAVRYAGMMLLYSHRSKATGGHTPISLLSSTHVPVKWMHIVFGERVSALVPKFDRTSKVTPVSEQAIFLGIDLNYNFAPVVLIPGKGETKTRVERSINIERCNVYYYTSWTDDGERLAPNIGRHGERTVDSDNVLQKITDCARNASPLPVPAATAASEEGVNQSSDTTPATSVPPTTTHAHMDRRNKQQHHPPNIDDNGNIEYEFSRILDSRRVGRRNEYLV